jgi:hypothetical protein
VKLTNWQWFLVGGYVALFGAACRVAFVPPQNTFELKGLHAELGCEDCHDPDEPIGPLPTDCASCHQADAPPDHFPGQPCEDCHSEFGWDGAAVDHDFLPLEDGHLLDCDACHTTPGVFTGLQNTCQACHEPDRPDAQHFAGMDCVDCHTSVTWDVLFDHGFLPLDGAHALSCEECHQDLPDFGGLAGECADCHEGDRPDPDHHAGRECGICHTPTSWEVAVDHGFFPLLDAHALACETCHLNIPDFTGLDGSCLACHEPDRPDPEHYPGRDCGVCHTSTSWETGIDHSFFPLVYAHAVDCATCHTAIPDFTGLDGECSNCHEAERPSPDHHPGRDCGVCHTAVAWDLGIDHSFFALQFGHALDCDACHTAIPDFTGLDANCSNCHLPDRPTPEHYPNFDCGGCHQITGWADGLDHSFFPLGNSHALECDACHANIPDFTGNSSACTACHEADRPDPGHFVGQDCAVCHSPSTWAEVASTDHSFFPLENSHALECDNCHVNGGYTGLTQACSSCHEIHRPGCHFTGQQCSDCHAPTSTWRLTATPINHAALFVMRVPHHEANTCVECHTTPNTQCEFTCLDCHDDAAGDHNGVNGFVNTNAGCIDCHPDGRN